MNDEYLRSFMQVQENESKLESLNEVPNWNNLESINETPDLSQYEINENLNDGWNIDCEVRVNGERLENSNPYIQQQKRKRKNDPNGLNSFMEDSINEVYQQNTITPSVSVNGSFKDVDVVSWDLFENINHQALNKLSLMYKDRI